MLTGQNVVAVDSGPVPYAVFLVTGTLLWQSFAEAIQIPVRVLSEAKSMLAKINFPREALPITAFGECCFGAMIRLLVLVVALWALDFEPNLTAPLALLGIIAMILLGLMIGIALAPFGLLYDDVSNGLALLLQVWMYCTPVIYVFPESGVLRTVAILNPVSPLLTQTRDWILSGDTKFIIPAIVVFAATLFLMFFTVVVYRIALPRAIERVSS